MALGQARQRKGGRGQRLLDPAGGAAFSLAKDIAVEFAEVVDV